MNFLKNIISNTSIDEENEKKQKNTNKFYNMHQNIIQFQKTSTPTYSINFCFLQKNLKKFVRNYPKPDKFFAEHKFKNKRIVKKIYFN